MKRHFFTVIILLATISFSYSQDYQIRDAMDLYRTSKVNSGDWKNTLTENDIKGSPYLNDEFINGTIYTKSKYKFVDIPLRYNIYNDQIEFKTPTNEVLALSTPEIVATVAFGDYKMVYLQYSGTKKIRYGFFIIEEEGAASLYSRLGVAFVAAEEPGGYKEAEPAKFVKKSDSFYIRIGLEAAKKVGSKKEVVEIFPDHHSEISTFIKKNKVKTNKPDKLKELVRYYNSL
ncbi:MAG: hypothetical protein L3J54_00325 [Draconibacterium sp.]|nr:hypothetical protein [Draconibacterium sp.]